MAVTTYNFMVNYVKLLKRLFKISKFKAVICQFQEYGLCKK